MTSLLIRALSFAPLWLGLLVPALHVPAAAAADGKRVLIIHSFGRDFAPFNAVGLALRTDLALRLKQPVVFQDISLESERPGPLRTSAPWWTMC